MGLRVGGGGRGGRWGESGEKYAWTTTKKGKEKKEKENLLILVTFFHLICKIKVKVYKFHYVKIIIYIMMYATTKFNYSLKLNMLFVIKMIIWIYTINRAQ